jgi:hypothetical protein
MGVALSNTNWNKHFVLIDAAELEKLRDGRISFDFKGNLSF